MVIHRFGGGRLSPFGSRPLRFAASWLSLVAVTLLAVWSSASCHYWRELPAPEKGFGQDVDHVRLRTQEGRELVVWYPRLSGDSLFGAASRDRRDSLDIRLGNVSELELQRTDTTTPLLMVFLLGGVTLAAVLASVQNMHIP